MKKIFSYFLFQNKKALLYFYLFSLPLVVFIAFLDHETCFSCLKAKSLVENSMLFIGLLLFATPSTVICNFLYNLAVTYANPRDSFIIGLVLGSILSVLLALVGLFITVPFFAGYIIITLLGDAALNAAKKKAAN